jgi:serine/threonine protein kinase
MPLEKKGSASLTQWIKVCNCNRPESDVTVVAPVNMCASCGKRIEVSRKGTMTQWIFRADLCSCEAPTLMSGEAQAAAASLGRVENLDDVEELELEPESFPFERYGPIGYLGKGASGTVYLCKDRLLKKKVAVKILNYLSSEQLIAFQREAKSTSQTEHANIVKVLDFGISDGKYPFMVLEYIDGISLEEVLERHHTIELEDTIRIFEQVCDALIFSHKRKLFHRDLKPTNIIVVGWGTDAVGARLIDFGVGVFKQEITAQGKSIAGSPPYMSPDPAIGLTFDERSEIYSLACVMFESLTGRPPFVGETALETMSLHAHEQPPSLSEAHGSMIFPESIESLITTCLSKSPDDRYQNMEELKLALSEILSEQQSEHSRSDVTYSVSTPAKQNRGLMVVLLLTSVLVFFTAGGIVLITTQLALRPQSVTKLKLQPLYQEPRLTDALNSMASDHWYMGVDSVGRTVWTSGSTISDKEFELLEDKAVTRVSVSVTDDVTGKGFGLLAEKPIVEISVNSTGLSDDGLLEIAKLKTLEVLRISVSSKFSLDGVKHIATLPRLQMLIITASRIPDGGLQEIAKMKTLKYLGLSNSRNIKLADVSALRVLPNLSYLDLSGSHLGDDIVPIVTKFKTLDFLSLSNQNLTDKYFDKIGKLSNLRTLQLDKNPNLSDRVLTELDKLKRLRVLVLDDCSGITPAAKANFYKRHPNIRQREIGAPQSNVMEANHRMMDELELGKDRHF